MVSGFRRTGFGGRTLTPLGLAMLIALWFVGVSPTPATAAASCNWNDICEPEYGEHDLQLRGL